MIGAATPASEPKTDPNAIMLTVIRGTLPLSNAASFIYFVKCVCPEKGQLGDFRDWNRVYNSCAEAKSPKNSITLRTHLLPESKTPRTTLMYYGLPDRRVPLPCERRAVTSVQIGPEADVLLSLLGCTFAFEYMRRGLRFRIRNGIAIDLFTIEKFKERGNIHSTIPLTPEQTHAVIEFSSEATNSTEELQAFVHHLPSYIHVHSPPQRKMSPKRRLSPQRKPS
ncbi:unnamed protein product [Agarophyton chilense]|eukprot:gb/GEZJ01003566.1/.p1 GENE.gb/GEZJ01003566.1/~~gb/GEZJ01003566.1/.p1  ORF type:complete len:224 (+),score=23.31 gb/GEZJ01003566.1/:340-1011(+)